MKANARTIAVRSAEIRDNLLGRDRDVTIFFIVISLFVSLLIPDIAHNKLADIDTWFYFSHFHQLKTHQAGNFKLVNDYYETRLPYIIPGYIIYHIFTDYAARVVFVFMIFLTIIFSMFLFLKRHFKVSVVMSAISLMIGNIFFLRVVGWQYVDNGVLAYEALTFSFLASAFSNQGRSLWLIFAASFTFTSMVFVHLGSAVLILPVIIYVLLFMSSSMWTWEKLGFTLLTALAGAVTCQLFYGLLNILLLHESFFFIAKQFDIGQAESASSPQYMTFDSLMGGASWLSMHIGVFFACIVALIIHLIKRLPISKMELFSFSSTILLYVIILMLELAHKTYFLERDGLYISFFFMPCYFAIACLISRLSRNQLATICICVLATALIAVKLEAGLQQWNSLPSIVCGLGIALAFVLLYCFSATRAAWIGLILLPLASFFARTSFASADIIYHAYDQIKVVTDQDDPLFLMDPQDKAYSSVIIPLVGTFGEGAWAAHQQSSPLRLDGVWHRQKVFVLSSSLQTLRDAQDTISQSVDDARAIAFFEVKGAQHTLRVSGFEICRAIVIPATNIGSGPNGFLSASALPGIVGTMSGDSRVAQEGRTNAGFLTYGPYASLTRGNFRARVDYQADSQKNGWDIVFQDGTKEVAVKSGLFPMTARGGETYEVQFSLPSDVQGLQVRTMYSGQGNFSVKSIHLVPVDACD